MPAFAQVRASASGALLTALIFAGTPLDAAEVKSAVALKKPLVLKTLTKEQIKALPDTDPIDVDGKITTKSQALADLQKIKPQAEAWAAQKASAALARFQKTSADFAAGQRTRIDSNNIRALAAVAQLRQQVEQKTDDKKPTPCPGPHIASVSTGSSAIYPGMVRVGRRRLFRPPAGKREAPHRVAVRRRRLHAARVPLERPPRDDLDPRQPLRPARAGRARLGRAL